MITEVETLDLISQLGREYVASYFAEDETIETIVDDLLAMQVLTPAIIKGTISNSIKDLTRSIQVDGDSILRALYRLRDTVGGYIEVDNDRELNWLDSIGEDKGQQVRYRKNLKGISRDIDYDNLVNRVYAYGDGEGEARIKLSDGEGVEEDYIEDVESQTTWGGIYTRVIVDRSITHPDTLMAWAEIYLEEHRDPPISYRVDAVDLSHSEQFDFSFEALQLGSTIKVIDEDLGIDVETIVVKIEHPDLLRPQDFILELAYRQKDISDTLAEVYDRQQFDQHIAIKIGAGQVVVLGGFTVIDWVTEGETTINGANIETGTVTLNHLNFVALTSVGDTDDIIATINASAEGLVIDANKVSVNAGKRIYKQPGIPTSNSEGDLWFDTDDSNKLYRAAMVGADEIKAGEWELVRDTQISTNASNITANANQISLNVTSINNLDGRVTTAEADIIVNADNILLKVNEDGVIAAINISPEEVKIDAARITLAGTVAVDDDIQSSNYVEDTSGWIIDGDGSAEFNNVKVRGTLYTSTIEAGETLTVNGAISAGDGTILLDVTGLKIVGQTIYFLSGASQWGLMGTGSAGGDALIIYSTVRLALISTVDIMIYANLLPFATAGVDLGNNDTLYFNAIYYKTLTDKGCPLPKVQSPLEALRNIKTKKRKITIEDANAEGMGTRAIARIENNPHSEFEEWDLNSFPLELLDIPSSGNISKAGIVVNELVYEQLKAIQELITRIEVLETRLN